MDFTIDRVPKHSFFVFSVPHIPVAASQLNISAVNLRLGESLGSCRALVVEIKSQLVSVQAHLTVPPRVLFLCSWLRLLTWDLCCFFLRHFSFCLLLVFMSYCCFGEFWGGQRALVPLSI